MAVMEITEFPEKVLKQAGEPVEEFGAELERLTSDMFETMYAAAGVGLAAPQVHEGLRLFVAMLDDEPTVRDNSVLVLNVGGSLPDYVAEDPANRFFGRSPVGACDPLTTVRGSVCA